MCPTRRFVSKWATQCASEWKERQTRRRTCSGVRSFPIPARSAWSSSSNPAAQCSSTCSIQPCDDHRSPSKYVTFVRKDSSSSANESTSKDHPSRQNTHRVVHIVHEARRIQVENIVHARHPLLRVRRHLLSEFPTNCRWHQEFARNSNCTRPATLPHVMCHNGCHSYPFGTDGNARTVKTVAVQSRGFRVASRPPSGPSPTAYF